MLNIVNDKKGRTLFDTLAADFLNFIIIIS
jgi:hypothetical protein